jgi:hypothetical protein
MLVNIRMPDEKRGGVYWNVGVEWGSNAYVGRGGSAKKSSLFYRGGRRFYEK